MYLNNITNNGYYVPKKADEPIHLYDSYVNGGIKMKKHGFIICGFPGVGKTEAVRRYGDRVHDSDSSKYVKFEGWEKGYCIDLVNMVLSGKYDYVLCSTHRKVVEIMNELYNDIPELKDDRFFIAMPGRDIPCEEWMKRFYHRNNDHIKNIDDFYSFLIQNWDDLVNQDYSMLNKSMMMYLGPDNYLSEYLY